jgi:hypothetical protein
VTAFSSATDNRLADALNAAFASRAPPPAGVVLDLRGNRGGLLGQAVAVASAFLADGVVARTSGRHPDAARTYISAGPDLARGVPLVVLVDGRTASAAEIVAAALSDRGRGVVVGSATTGKGLIQAVVPLPNGGELLVTWSRVLAPRGWPIQGLGVLPALCTSLGAEATAAALVQLRRGEAPMGRVLARLRAARAPARPPRAGRPTSPRRRRCSSRRRPMTRRSGVDGRRAGTRHRRGIESLTPPPVPLLSRPFRQPGRPNTTKASSWPRPIPSRSSSSAAPIPASST